MRKLCVLLALLAFVLITAAAAAESRPHEGKITNLDLTAKTLTVQTEKGDQFTLSWDQTTKFKSDLTAEELTVGDSIHFDFVDKDGRMWATEIHRTRKVKM